MFILDFLQKYGDAFGFLATLLFIFVTYLYVRLTRKMVNKYNEPNIEVRLESDPVNSSAVVAICVENFGTGNAYNLKFEPNLSNTTELFNIAPLESIGFIKNGIRCLSGGTRRESRLTSVIGKFEKQKSNPITIKVSYEDSKGHKCKPLFFLLDFTEFDRIAPIPTDVKYFSDISKILKELQKNLSKFVGQSGVPRVTVQSPIDANIENYVWPFLGGNSIDNTPIDVQRENIQEILNLIPHNPWYKIYTELSKLPPEIQRDILHDLNSKFAEWST